MPNKTQKSPQQSQIVVSRPQAGQNGAFVKHLERASGVVHSWPIWKQELLGGKAAQSAAKPAKATIR